MKQKIYRHGEIGFLKIKSLPKDLKEEKTNVIVKGSHGNSHSFRGGKIYFKNEGTYAIGYLRAKNTTLLHPEHGETQGSLREAKLPDGNYQILKQQEFTPSGLVPVID